MEQQRALRVREAFSFFVEIVTDSADGNRSYRLIEDIVFDEIPEEAQRILRASVQKVDDAALGQGGFGSGLEEQQRVHKRKAAVQRDVAKIADRLSTRLQSNVLLGLGPSGLKSHGPESLYFVERLKEQVPAMIPFLVVVGEGGTAYRNYPSILVAEEDPGRAAASLRVLGSGTLQYLADETETSDLTRALEGIPIAVAQRPVSTLPLILQQILSTLAGLDPGLSQAEVEVFYGINLNDLADHLKELSRIGV